MHPSRDHHLPPDTDAYRHAPHPKGRIIVIAPTRAACETIELALGLRLDTLLEREHGAEIRALAGSGKGFGIVAGTGTGKTLGIRPIAESILGEELRVGVVNREREATPETPSWNVVIVTTGIARRWFQDDLITGRDTVIVDEIHQTSAELELCLALGKRARLPLHLAQRDGGSDVLLPLSRQRRGPAHLRVRPQAQGPRPGASPEAGRISRRPLRPPHHQGAARRGGVPADPGGGRAAGRGARGAVEAPQHRLLSRRRADPRDPALPRGRGGAAVSAGHDRGGPVGAQRARPRHRDHLRRPLRQRGRAGAQRPPPALSRRQRDPADGRAGCTDGCRMARS